MYSRCGSRSISLIYVGVSQNAVHQFNVSVNANQCARQFSVVNSILPTLRSVFYCRVFKVTFWHGTPAKHIFVLSGQLRQGVLLQRTFCTKHDPGVSGETTTESVRKPSTGQVQSTESNGLLPKLRKSLSNFFAGFKQLVLDVRKAAKTRRKLGLYQKLDMTSLTREEARHLRQTRKDLVKTLPIAALFMVPIIGYAAPVLAYFFPKQLLSQQFWHPEQKKQFVLEEWERRSQYYRLLLKEVGITSKEIKNKELLQLCLQVLDGKHPSTADLLLHKDEFSRDNELSLETMPRYHLVKLCRCWLVPTRWYLPRWFLVSALRKRILHVHEDDVLISRDGIDLLTSDSVKDAVHVRGLDETSLCNESERRWLKEWMDLSVQVTDGDVSFLAHAAVFKAANFEALSKNREIAALQS